MRKQKKHKINPEILQRAKQLRRDQTSAENKLWYVLRNRQLGGYKFRRQQPIGRFIVDFLCKSTKLVIEIDGDTHAERVGYDVARTKKLEEKGYKVIRYMNSDVHDNLENVALNILENCDSRIEELGT